MSTPTTSRPAAGGGAAPGTAVPAARVPGSSAFTGTGALIRLALRRDRVLLPVWIGIFILSAYETAAATIAVYPDAASLRAYTLGINRSTSLVALYGPVWDPGSLGSGAMFKMSAFGCALVAVLTMILTVRHTRGEEENGRLELLGAGVLGRLAPLTAAVTVTSTATLTIGLLSAAALVGAGLQPAGSLAFGLSWIVAGLAFTAVAAVTAQLATAARAATGLAAAVLGVTYVLRAIGDVNRASGGGWLSWLSPIGWGQQIKPFAGDRWWVTGVGLAFTAVATGLAYLLASRRDLGGGLLADRAGRAAATGWLRGPFTLALRLQRGLLIGWTVGFVTMGAVMGSMAGSIGSMIDGPSARDMITKLGGMSGLVDAFFAVELSMMAIIASIFAVQAMGRLRAEESAGHVEPLLATAAGRRRLMLDQAAVAAGGGAWLLLAGGSAAGLAAAASLHDSAQFPRLLAAGLAQLPALLVTAGVTAAAVGLAPRAAVAGWVFLVGCLLLGELGPLLRVPQWAIDLSPFTHAPKPGHLTATPLLWLTLVAAALIIAGVEGFRRRDVS